MLSPAEGSGLDLGLANYGPGPVGGIGPPAAFCKEKKFYCNTVTPIYLHVTHA